MKAIKSEIGLASDKLLSMSALAMRWGIHPKVARQRLKKLNAPVIKFNLRTCYVRASWVERLEKEATVNAQQPL
jgi:hypothetical protein